MKRRLLSAFLAVMMVLTMAPVAFAADTSATVSTQDELLTALNDASITEITLTNDIALTGVWTPVEIAQGRTLVINGAGNTISDLKVTGGILAPSGSGVAGDGHSCDYYAAFIGVNKGTLTINNLKFTNADVDIKPVTVSLASTGSSMISVVCANNAGDMVYNDVEVQNCVVRGYTKVGLLNGFTSPAKTGSFVANHCAIVNCEVVVEADGTDPEASLNAAIIGYDGYNHAKTNGIKLQNVTCTIDESVKWADGIQTKEDGTKYCGRWGIYSPTYAHDNYDVKTVPMVAEIDGYQYESLADAIAAAEDGDTVTLLTNTAEDITIAQDKDITLDLNGKTLTNSAGDTITVALGANLTIEGEGTVDNISHGKAAVYNNGFVTLNGGTYTRSKETGDVKVDKNSYYNILNHGSMTINKDVTVEQSGNFSSLVVNGYYDYEGVTSKGEKSQYIEGTNVAEPTLTIKGGTFSGGINTLKNDDGGNITINGGTVTNYTQAALQNHNVATINGGTFTADSKYVIDDCGCNEAHDSGELMIFGGTFMGKLYVRSPYSKVTIMDGLFKGDVLKTGGTLSTIGGYYSTDVAKYCPIGWTTVANTDKDTKDAYPYTIGVIPEIKDNEVKADVATGATNSTVDTEKITTEAAQNAATTVANTVATTKPIADKSELTENDKKNAVTALKNAGQVTVDADGTISKNVTVIKQTYLDVTATEYVIGDTDDTYRVTMDITPKYNLVAVATENNEAVDVAKGVAYLQGQYLMNAGKTEVTVTLPTQYANKKVYITHKDDVYIATADESGKITFTTNGFSPFTFALTNPGVVAEVNGNAYKSLQEAANAANNGDEITVVQNKNLDLTFNTTKSVKVTNKTDDKITVKFNGTNKDVAKNATETFSYTKPSSGSSGGSSSGKTTYKVTTSAVNNGGVNASPSNAEKGATITITLSPDKGYKLDKLTVTDGSGKTVSTVKKSDTVYTFAMPASAVTVGVSYVKATETPSETKFNDVSANDWFASAVDYVTGKGMMNGTADNTFSPKANTTRGMVVTVLYRLENQPSTSAASFTDVASGAYYANAVAWANANGIVSGYGSGKFGPNDKVTREQLAAILYRYAQYKKYDVSGAKSLDGYTDAQSVSSYAVPALQWANAAGIVTGKSGSKLDPKGNATRAEVAAMLMRFCENVK